MKSGKSIGRSFRMTLMFVVIGAMLGGLAGIDSIFASPSSHGKDNIISDVEYRNYQSMSLPDIQNFLENPRWGDGYLGRASYLATYTTMDYQGVERSAAEIIYNAARDYLSQGYQISPELILTTLQKEQTLVTTSSPSDYALNWAMGYAVGNDNWKGFGKQVDAGGWQLGYDYKYIETHGSKNGWGPGISKQTLDGVTVTPENIATACLYDYTPHAGAGWGGSGGGNYLFWDLYYNYFHFGDEEDTNPPTVDAFDVNPLSVTLGDGFTISYTVSDTGGSGLNRVELWRRSETVDWQEIKRTSISGDDYFGSFTDAPPSIGTYWYGIHVVDNTGNWNDERNSHTGGLPGVFGPIQVEVIQANSPPQLSSGYVDPSSGTPSTSFYYYVTYFDPDGDSPSVEQVIIDGIAYTMNSYLYENSYITYRCGPKNLSAGGTHYYFFYFEDGKGATVRLPSGIDTYLGPSVTPEPYPPQVTTEGASSITTSSAALTGNLDSTGGETCQVWFEYGTTTSYGSSTSKLTMSSTGPFGTIISSLNPDTTYHFRACAQNSKDTSYGFDMTFKTEPADRIVTFPDPNLEAAIREAINKPEGDIYQSELEGLTSLDASNRGIANTAGLEYCTNLTELNLTQNEISDVSPLSNLTHLTRLFLMMNQISDVSPLSDLLSLEYLGLEINQLTDISLLYNLTSLTYLNLLDNQISDISPLAGLTNLTRLLLFRNQISDISALSNLTSLTWLDLGWNQITDISTLANLTNLQQVWLGHNQISDISALANLTSLTTLNLRENQISCIAPLSVLTSLTHLYLWWNQISDITPLSNLTSLTYLNLGANRISDISPLSNLSDLTHLDLAGNQNQISDIWPLSNLTSLTYLQLGGSQISDITPLSNLTALTGLYIAANRISDIWPLSNLTGLITLDLGGNQISDISALSNLTSLTSVSLRQNQINDISSLSNLTSLTRLFLWDNYINDITALSNLSSLRRVYLNGNQITSITALAGLTEMRALYLDDNQIADVAPLSGLTMLGDIYEGLLSERQGIRICLGLRNNQTNDICPLVQNEGLGEGDGIDIGGNPLDGDSLNTYIPQLQARGVEVLYDALKTWYVDDDLVDYPDADFTRIQEAVGAANSGDTVIVYPGTYTENVEVFKQLSIVGHNGTSDSIPRVEGLSPGVPAIMVTANSVSITGLHVCAPTAIAVHLYNSVEHCTISECVCSDSLGGITLWGTRNTTVSGNKILCNSYSIHLDKNCSGCTIEGNTCSENNVGIYIQDSRDNIISRNTCIANEYGGMYLHGSNNNIVSSNTFSNNGLGIIVHCSNDNIVYLNSFSNTDANVVHSVNCPPANIWNSPEEVTYTYNGNTHTNYLGNYWSDYAGGDADGDGIGETPYPLDSDADNYPLMEPFENYVLVENQVPVASIDLDYAYVQSGASISFDGSNSDDPDGMIVNYEWDFGDGTVLEGPDPQSVEHRFRGAMVDPETLVPEIKNYSVTLKVTDDKGATATDTASIDVVPLQKTIENTVPPAPTPGGSAEMTAYYNWIGVTADTGEDIYVVSAIHFEAEGFVSHLLTVWDEYSFSIGIPAWSEAVIHFWHPVERTFAYPFGTYRDCTYTFDDGYFQGMAVGRSDEMRLWSLNVVSISGAIGPVWFGVSTPFAPDLAGGPITDEAPPDLTLAHLCSPTELRVYDSEGNGTGLVNGEAKEEIPDSGYSDEIVVILNPSDSYWYEVLGTDDGEYGLAVTSVEDGGSATFTATDIPTTSGAVHQYTIDWDALSEGGEGVTVQIDCDGDGVFEETMTSDGELTHGEFMLQTATIIDFDPDVLDLKARGRFVTVYIELPEGYDVEDIDVSSIMLNGSIQALGGPTEIGDYNNSGIPDLMVKFDKASVQSIISVGEQVEITVTGQVAGTTFEGSDIIRVIDNWRFPQLI